MKKKTETTRCYNCQNYGHLAASCSGSDRTRSCWRCGTEGYKAVDCFGKPQCYLCVTRGEKPQTGHFPETMRCAAFREEAPNRKLEKPHLEPSRHTGESLSVAKYEIYELLLSSNAKRVPELYFGPREEVGLVGITSVKSHPLSVNAFYYPLKKLFLFLA